MRKRKVQDWSSHIERLVALRELAESGTDSTPAEIQKLDRNIRASRQEIIDLLTIEEVKELTRRGLRPERAGEVIQETVPAALSTDFTKMAAAAQNAAQANLRYSVATKGGAETGDRLEKFVFASSQPGVPHATIADAFLNHNERRQS